MIMIMIMIMIIMIMITITITINSLIEFIYLGRIIYENISGKVI